MKIISKYFYTILGIGGILMLTLPTGSKIGAIIIFSGMIIHEFLINLLLNKKQNNKK